MLSVLMLVAGMSTHAFSQKGTVAAGGDASGAGGGVSYSIGQIDYVTATGTGGSALQGNQQPFEISVITGIEINAITLEMGVYPNPTFDNVTLKVSGNEFSKLNYTLIGLDGKVIRQENVNGETTTIPMNELAKGLYIINVYDQNKSIKSFNIIKN